MDGPVNPGIFAAVRFLLFKPEFSPPVAAPVIFERNAAGFGSALSTPLLVFWTVLKLPGVDGFALAFELPLKELAKGLELDAGLVFEVAELVEGFGLVGFSEERPSRPGRKLRVNTLDK